MTLAFPVLINSFTNSLLNSGETSLRGILIAFPLPLVWGAVSVADGLAVVLVAVLLAVLRQSPLLCHLRKYHHQCDKTSTFA